MTELEQYFEWKCRKGLKEKELDTKEEYVKRLEYEIDIIKRMRYSNYFLVVADVLQYCLKNEIRVGPGRGCFLPQTPVVLSTGNSKNIEDIQKREKVISHDGSANEVLSVHKYDIQEEVITFQFCNNARFTCTLDHEILVVRNGIEEWLQAKEISFETNVITIDQEQTKISAAYNMLYCGPVYDLTVANVHTYNANGIAVHNSAAGSLAAYCLGITHVDPIKYGLIFERFLNPGRYKKYIIDFPEFSREKFNESR